MERSSTSFDTWHGGRCAFAVPWASCVSFLLGQVSASMVTAPRDWWLRRPRPPKLLDRTNGNVENTGARSDSLPSDVTESEISTYGTQVCELTSRGDGSEYAGNRCVFRLSSLDRAGFLSMLAVVFGSGSRRFRARTFFASLHRNGRAYGFAGIPARSPTSRPRERISALGGSRVVAAPAPQRGVRSSGTVFL